MSEFDAGVAGAAAQDGGESSSEGVPSGGAALEPGPGTRQLPGTEVADTPVEGNGPMCGPNPPDAAVPQASGQVPGPDGAVGAGGDDAPTSGAETPDAADPHASGHLPGSEVAGADAEGEAESDASSGTDAPMCGPDAPRLTEEDWRERTGAPDCERQVNIDGNGDLYTGCSALSGSEISDDLNALSGGAFEAGFGSFGQSVARAEGGNVRDVHDRIQQGAAAGRIADGLAGGAADVSEARRRHDAVNGL